MTEKNVTFHSSLEKHQHFVADVCLCDAEESKKQILTVSHDGFLFVHEDSDENGKYSVKEKYTFAEKASFVRGEVKFCCVVTKDRRHVLITEREHVLVISLPDFRLEKRIRVMSDNVMCNIWRLIEITNPFDNKIMFAICVSYSYPEMFSGTVKIADLEGNIRCNVVFGRGINAMYQLRSFPESIICGGFEDGLYVVNWKKREFGRFSEAAKNEGLFTNSISGFFDKNGEERIISVSGNIKQSSGGGKIIIWDIRGKCLQRFPNQQGIVCMLRCSDRFFMFGGNNGSIYSLHLFENERRRKNSFEFEGRIKLEVKKSHQEFIWDMCWISPYQFASCGHDKTTKIYSIREMYLDMRRPNHYRVIQDENDRLDLIFGSQNMQYKCLKFVDFESNEIRMFFFLTILIL